MCRWDDQSIVCADASGGTGLKTIAEIRLPGAGLAGTVPPDLLLLPALRVLDLSGNSLNGTLPAATAALSASSSRLQTLCVIELAQPRAGLSPSLQGPEARRDPLSAGT